MPCPGYHWAYSCWFMGRRGRSNFPGLAYFDVRSLFIGAKKYTAGFFEPHKRVDDLWIFMWGAWWCVWSQSSASGSLWTAETVDTFAMSRGLAGLFSYR